MPYGSYTLGANSCRFPKREHLILTFGSLLRNYQHMDDTSPPPTFARIAALRRERGETLEAFGRAIGIVSKGRISELERGLRAPTPDQALAIEKISDGRIDAASLNDVVRAARQQSHAEEAA